MVFVPFPSLSTGYERVACDCTGLWPIMTHRHSGPKVWGFLGLGLGGPWVGGYISPFPLVAVP
ncbi:hypothetical protein M408DRAFT_329706 [Serendipita vermifera MAFF 305830]|uniref:Uncharacterized protein n=1 Tax=Serendipita vermifera MAFF 305830 TaxID=933852 RepID=A0A0C3B9D1_SERVB|nr:hypothetical protein M408DRAFT_329706 [Serendipita vermifera MAFF 305830]